MKKTMLMLTLLVVAGALVFAGGRPEADPDRRIAAMATDVGGLGDQSFNDGAYQGLLLGAPYGFEARVVESNQQTDYIPNLSGLAEDGAEIVFAVGFLMEDAVKEAARMHPDTLFGGIDIGGDDDLPNFQGILYREEQSGYLAGVLAGLMTKDHADAIPRLRPDHNVVGAVLGMLVPPVERFEVGFIQGVKSVNPDATVLSVTAGSFVDQAGGREAALAMIEQGADIVFQAAGLTGLGVIQAADEEGVLAIGVDIDQNHVAPDAVLTSAIKKIPESVEVVLRSIAEGTFQGGTVSYGLAEDATGLAPFHGFDSMIPQEVKDALEAARQGILDGSIEIATSRSQIQHLMD
ncbi:nucleoside-binding protein [Alkalispirochaeta americana]|uniref:Nucleoside-binding protein n=1 Tax=Alkalispirochaeta americana TaxID=159291 RepID=A0A1N6RVY9_9SPIO|nr:BMP family ABC transporter substrate-binding protein [Alkalispirochaeta americana]SIQ32916.1 nucleoside-binding protein [Alkalispirochaeta americana]